jgi:hypothetical protein
VIDACSKRYVLGLDLAQPQDYTALALIEWQLSPPPGSGAYVTPPHYNVRTLSRWPMGTSYRDIIAALTAFLRTPPLDKAVPTLVIDDTAVGLPVARMVFEGLARAQLNGACCGVTITDGHDVQHHASARWHVPKKVLVSTLQVLLQARRLLVAAALPEAQTLLKELQAFRSKVTAVRTETLESWREREYDDLVFAVAIACWWAEQKQDWFLVEHVSTGPECIVLA